MTEKVDIAVKVIISQIPDLRFVVYFLIFAQINIRLGYTLD
jgi:hypothetical protein